MTPAVDVDTVERALHAWVTSTSGIPGNRVIWSDRGSDRPDTQWISLKLSFGTADGIGWASTEDNPLTFVPLNVSAVDTVGATLTSAGHARVTGDGPVQFVGTLPSGLTVATDYWLVAPDADHLQIAADYLDAIADVPVVIALGAGAVLPFTINATADTVRVGEETRQVVHSYYSATLSVQCYGGPATGGFKPNSVLQTVSASSVLPSIRNALEAGGCGIVGTGPVHDVGAVINTATYEPRAAMDVTLWVSSSVFEFAGRIDSVEATVSTDDEGDITFEIP